MALSLYTAPTTEPVTVAEAKLHIRATEDTVEDALVSSLITAAREYCETFTRRSFLPQVWDLKLDSFCDPAAYKDGVIWLPKPPVTAVTSITYLDTAGDSQTLSTSIYTYDLPSGPKASRARVQEAYGQVFPQTRSTLNAVTIRFAAGYATAAAVPYSIKAAMLLLIGHWYQNRETVVVGVGIGSVQVPTSAEALLWPYVAY
jgi:uncharacterized phiE125 gp8 family phage protein